MKTKIILDTNFLLIPTQFNVDIFSEIKRICDFSYELVVVSETVLELKGLVKNSKTSGKDKKAAKLALHMLKTFKVKTLHDNRKLFKRADEAIVLVANKNTVVATQDRKLKKQLKSRRIVLRKKQHLIFEN